MCVSHKEKRTVAECAAWTPSTKRQKVLTGEMTVTNAAGGLNSEYNVGDIVLLNDARTTLPHNPIAIYDGIWLTG